MHHAPLNCQWVGGGRAGQGDSLSPARGGEGQGEAVARARDRRSRTSGSTSWCKRRRWRIAHFTNALTPGGVHRRNDADRGVERTSLLAVSRRAWDAAVIGKGSRDTALETEAGSGDPFVFAARLGLMWLASASRTRASHAHRDSALCSGESLRANQRELSLAARLRSLCRRRSAAFSFALRASLGFT